MKTHTPILRFVVLLLLLALAALNPQLATLHAQGTAFTYQGRLNSSGSPVTGSYDLEFTVYPTNQNGSPVTPTITNLETFISNGLFTVPLDFGGVFTGSNYWLDIAVRPAGIGNYTELSPRQPLTPAPYAIFANTASNLNGTLPASQLTGALPALSGANLTNLNAANLTTGTLPLAQLPAAVVTNGESGVTVGGTNVVAPLTVTPDLSAAAVGTIGGVGFQNMTVAGNYVYGVDGNSAFYVIDVSIPSAPAVLCTLTGFHGANALAVNGRYAYVINSLLSGGYSLQVVDVGNPTNAALVSTVGVGSALALAVSGRYGYVATGSALNVVDLANPASPAVVGGANITGNPNPSGLAVSGRYAYVVDVVSPQMLIFDLGNPVSPVQVGSFTATGSPFPVDVAVAGRYAYIANEDSNSLAVVDVSSPTHPVQVGSVTFPSQPFRVSVAGRYAYVSVFSSNQIAVVDVSNPSSPVTIGNINCPFPSVFTAAGRYLYVSDQSGFQVFDIGGEYVQQLEAGSTMTGKLQTRDTATVGNNLDVRGGLTVSGSARISGGLSVDNGSITASNFTGNASGLTNLNASQLTGALPAISGANLTGLNAGNITGTIPLAQLPAAVVTNGENGVSIGGTNVVAQLTIPPSFPTQPVGTASFANTYGTPLAIAVAGRTVYLVGTSSFGNVLEVVDVSTPGNPGTIGSFSIFFGYPNCVAAAGRYLYYTDSQNRLFGVVDASDPAELLSAGSLTLSGEPGFVVTAGRYAYVVDNASNMYVIDVSRPASPSLVSTISTGAASVPSSLAVAGRYAYVANTGLTNLQIVDLNNPSSPVLAGAAATGATPEAVAVSGRYAYVVCSGAQNVEIFDVSNPGAPSKVGTVAIGGGARWIAVAGRYAYVANSGGTSTQIIDVGNPASPLLVDSISTPGNGPGAVAVSGRYLYVNNNSELQIYDLGGAYIQQMEAGTIETGTLQTRDNAVVGNNLDVRGGLTVSGSARVSGGLSVDGGAITATNISSTTYAGSGAGLTNLTATNISGMVPLANLPAGLITNNQSGATLNSLTVGGPLNLTSPITITAAGGKFITSPGGGANIFVGVGSGNTNGLTGGSNTGMGQNTLAGDTSGANNAAFGYTCMVSNLNGADNTAIGYEALFKNTSGSQNIAIGDLAGQNITTTSGNIDIGSSGVAGDSSTIRIGSTQTNTVIAGISGVTASGGAAVFVTSSGQLGTVTSSARFKEDIKSMDDASDVLLSLRPVTFKYKPDLDPKGIPQFGLVAEEVEKADPDLVLHDQQGKLYTVRYEAVNAMLLNEFLKQHHQVEKQNSELKEQSAEIRDFNQKLTEKDADISALKDRLAALETAVKSLADKQ